MGFAIVDMMESTQEAFFRLTGAALELMATSDARRFKRVQKEIRTIVHAPSGLYVAQYSRASRECSFDLRYFYDKEPNVTPKLIGSALVHEATHGALYSAGILQTRRNFVAVERLCNQEARRFLAGVGITSSPWDVMDETSLAPQSLWLRLKQIPKDVKDGVCYPADYAEVWKGIEPKLDHTAPGSPKREN